MIDPNLLLNNFLNNEKESVPPTYKRYHLSLPKDLNMEEMLQFWQENPRWHGSAGFWREFGQLVSQDVLYIPGEAVILSENELNDDRISFMHFLISQGYSFHHIRQHLLVMDKIYIISKDEEGRIDLNNALDKAKDLRAKGKSGGRKLLGTLICYLNYQKRVIKLKIRD